MTLAQQFPDISMSIREKNKLNFKYNTALLFKDQKFYDTEFRVFHYKLLGLILAMLASVYLIILNGQSIWRWIVS
jgi:hypothetical protein